MKNHAEFFDSLPDGSSEPPETDHSGPGSFPSSSGMSLGVPAWERWEIRTNFATVQQHAEQLDFLGIELGLLEAEKRTVDYVSKLSQERPVLRSGNPEDEQRVRFMPKGDAACEAERELAAKTGLEMTDRVLMEFWPQEMYVRLLTLENQAMGPRRISSVKKTVFGLRGGVGDWKPYLIEQTYWPDKNNSPR